MYIRIDMADNDTLSLLQHFRLLLVPFPSLHKSNYFAFVSFLVHSFIYSSTHPYIDSYFD